MSIPAKSSIVAETCPEWKKSYLSWTHASGGSRVRLLGALFPYSLQDMWRATSPSSPPCTSFHMCALRRYP
jgi:hypothetical protein